MFTGIIEELGRAEAVRRTKDGMKLTIRAQKVLDGTKEGDSINVNGVCLTVVEVLKHGFRVDVIKETMLKTTFSSLRQSDKINLERALQVTDRLGGHFVAGHVDGVGKIVGKRAEMITIEARAEIMRYIFPRASIAVDGISLTVQKSYGNRFEVGIIPHTALITTLGSKKQGESVNLEVDLISKQVEMFLQQKGITGEFLSKHRKA